MGKHQVRHGDTQISQKQNIQIERPRPIRKARRTVTSEFLLDRQQLMQQRSRRVCSLQRNYSISKPWLVCIADRFREIE